MPGSLADVPMQANVVIAGAPAGFERLTYSIPPALAGRVEPGHRVIVPLRARKLTGIVTETSECFSTGTLKPILELLEPQPLFDRAHLELMDFLASYYMVSIGDAYRTIIPRTARVETRVAYRLAQAPNPLARAALTSVERAILAAAAKGAMTARKLEKLGPPGEVRAAVARFIAEGIFARRDAVRGRHRAGAGFLVTLKPGVAPENVRGDRQREAIRLIAAAPPPGLPVESLKQAVEGGGVVLKNLVRRGLVEIRDLGPSPDELMPGGALDPTQEQQTALDAISPAIAGRRFETFLVWGVTASGKTEIYLQLAARALAAGLNVLVMTPEIALTGELVRAFRARFGALVAVAHSAQTIAERWASWMAAIGGRARIMIGPRSAIFAPLREVGLVVVDEEHDPAYKSEEGIRYHARDLAVALGGYSKCPVVLGSATPSAESYANARRGRYRLIRLARRINDRAMAAVEVIDLRREPADAAAAKNGTTAREAIPLSQALVAAMRENLADGGQCLVFLNRRGFHNFLQCHLCGNVIACPNCSVSMTFHLRDRSVRCHYCGHHAAAPDACPECGGYGLAGQGFGTERIANAIAELMPAARIARMDSDTTARKGERELILGQLRAREIDVLIGTQMITKGLDFPGVTLVAVVLADLALNIPDFRSAERTFQLLTQVSGRAGRGERPGRVIIQTYAPNHYSIRAARDQDYARFIRRELDLRRELQYPPFARLAMIRIEGEEPCAVARIADAAAKSILRTAEPETIRVLGPAPAPIERIKGRYRWQVMVKSRELKPVRAALTAMRSAVASAAARDQVHLTIDIDPVRML